MKELFPIEADNLPIEVKQGRLQQTEPTCCSGADRKNA